MGSHWIIYDDAVGAKARNACANTRGNTEP